MQKDMASHRFLEYGTHENALYGTKLDTIRDVINSGYVAVLDVEPPVIIFIPLMQIHFESQPYIYPLNICIFLIVNFAL